MKQQWAPASLPLSKIRRANNCKRLTCAKYSTSSPNSYTDSMEEILLGVLQMKS